MRDSVKWWARMLCGARGTIPSEDLKPRWQDLKTFHTFFAKFPKFNKLPQNWPPDLFGLHIFRGNRRIDDRRSVWSEFLTNLCRICRQITNLGRLVTFRNCSANGIFGNYVNFGNLVKNLWDVSKSCQRCFKSSGGMLARATQLSRPSFKVVTHRSPQSTQ